MLVFAFLFWQTAFELTKIEVAGLSRFQPAAVLKTVGLAEGSKAGKAEFDAACQRLIHTGLFEGCNWKYAPSSATGVTLTLQLQEAPAEQSVRLTVPGVANDDLWTWLKENEPLVQMQMPASDEAIQFYNQAIRRYLKQDVVSSINTNLQTKENTLVFRPANVPSVESVKFEGAEAIPASTLEERLTPLARGTPFTEYDIAELLRMNITPMYWDLGRLNVKFPRIQAQGGAVTITVEEGPVYNIGDVSVTGADAAPKLVKGDAAKWRQITDALDAVSAVMQNNGHLNAAYKVDRKLNDASGTVDLAVAYTEGEQFRFRALKLDGLTRAQEASIRPLWTLPPGAPMNAGYVNEFIKAAFQKLGGEYSGVATQTEPGEPGTVDVVIGFRRR